jgi:hypothetical protein
MRIILPSIALLASAVTGFGAGTPISLTANNLSIATGQPSLVLMSSGSVHVPVWSLSGGTVGQSVAGLVTGLPKDCAAVKVEIVVTTTDATTSPDFEDVYRVHLSQMVEDAPFTAPYHLGNPVRTALPAAPFHSRTIVLESYYEVQPNAPLWVRIQREPGDPADTFTKPTGLAMVKVTPLEALAKPHVVQDVSGYNSWPMIQAIGDKLVCVYSRGKGHTIAMKVSRAVYARTSTDGGKTWTPETVVANCAGLRRGRLSARGWMPTGAMLLWVRRIGKGEWHHDLYRTTDGVTFTLVATPKLAVRPMQITDIFAVPKVGLMALWFAGDYGDKPTNAWGTVTSSDNGATWTQTTVESELPKAQWPTEPAAVYLGEGKILAIARTEVGPTQWQIVSTDSGATWKRTPTNISDIKASTPSLILDAKTGLLSNYYYHRGKGLLRRRVVDPRACLRPSEPLGLHPRSSPRQPSYLGCGQRERHRHRGTHYLSFYSGKAPDTSVLVSVLPAPSAR